jgi:putative hydrolase of the HAD superfamily
MIQNIIFDLGGVLLDIDFNKTKNAFQSIGYPHFDELFTQYYSSPLFENLETGTIHSEDFLSQLQQYSKQPVTIQQLIDAWNAMLGGFRMKEIEFVRNLKPQFSIILFSNTNAIHHIAFQKEYSRLTGKNFDDNFHFTHYSHILGKRKPLPESFSHLLNIHSLKASETLFIDDSHNNIEGALQAGLFTHLLKSEEKVSEILPRLFKI